MLDSLSKFAVLERRVVLSPKGSNFWESISIPLLSIYLRQLQNID
jgi:hypothetical protein